MRLTLDWEPFYEIARTDLPYREKLRQYAQIARRRFDADRFEEFCATHLPHLHEVAWEFFAGDVAKDAVRQKVAALYPAREVEEYTELFFARIQLWRQDGAQGRRRARRGHRAGISLEEIRTARESAKAMKPPPPGSRRLGERIAVAR
jgi:hypothetical protein